MQEGNEQLYIGLNKQLYRITGYELNETGSAVAARLFPVSNEDFVNSWSDMGSGVFSGNMEVGGGYIQSGNFKSGESGWRLDSAGNLEANDGTFRGDLQAETGTIGGTTISSTALTGGIIQTASSGTRIVLQAATGGDEDELAFYNGSTRVGAIVPDVSVPNVGFDIGVYRSGDAQNDPRAYFSMLTNGTSGLNQIEIRVAESGIHGIDVEYLDSDGFATIDINGVFDSDLDPDGDETRDIGNSSSKWADIWCDTIHRSAESSPSDRRLKKDIEDISWGLEQITALHPVSFKWKKTNKMGYGFIAQEMKTILPDLVSSISESEDIRDPDTNKKIGKRKVYIKGEYGKPLLQIEQSALVPILVKAVQELTTRVEELENSGDNN